MPENLERPARGHRIMSRMATAVGMILACLAMTWLGVRFGRPYMLARAGEEENARLERSALDLQMENQELRKRVRTLSTPAGMEVEARKNGFVRPGEVPLLVPEKTNSDRSGRTR